MKKKLYLYILCIIIFLKYEVNVFANDDTITIDLSDTDGNYYVQSDGMTEDNNYTNGDYNIESNEEASIQYTQAELNALSIRNNILNTLQDWYESLKSNMSNSYNSGYEDNITSLTIGYIPKTDIAELLNYINDLRNMDDAAWVSSYNTLPQESLYQAEDSQYNMLSPEEKIEIREEIALNENPLALIRIIGNAGLILGENEQHGLYNISDVQGTGKIMLEKYKDDTFQMNINNPFSNTGNPVRTDMYSGFPSLRDTNNYTDRFNGFFGIANNENWITYWGNNGVIHYSYDNNIIGGGSTASLSDDISIALLTNYHIYSVKKDYITNINYASDERRWTVYLNGVQVSEPVITDNPEHELNFTEIYETYGTGLYNVTAEQLAYVTKATYIQYDICEYLYETDTGNILYYKESLVRNSGGGSLYLNEATSETPEWHRTGDEFTISVNDLGQYTIDGSATEREE